MDCPHPGDEPPVRPDSHRPFSWVCRLLCHRRKRTHRRKTEDGRRVRARSFRYLVSTTARYGADCRGFRHHHRGCGAAARPLPSAGHEDFAVCFFLCRSKAAICRTTVPSGQSSIPVPTTMIPPEGGQLPSTSSSAGWYPLIWESKKRQTFPGQ